MRNSNYKLSKFKQIKQAVFRVIIFKFNFRGYSHSDIIEQTEEGIVVIMALAVLSKIIS